MIFRTRLKISKFFLLTLALSVTLSSWVNPKMARSQSKSFFSSKTVISEQSSVIKLKVEAEFCLNSSNECVQELTESAIASLEIRTADLLAAKAELERQQSEEKVKISDRVLRLLLDYEAAQRRHKLLSSQLKTLEQQQRVARVSYRRGRGSSSQMLGMSDKRDRISEKIVNAEIEQDEAVRELGQLIEAKLEK